MLEHVGTNGHRLLLLYSTLFLFFEELAGYWLITGCCWLIPDFDFIMLRLVAIIACYLPLTTRPPGFSSDLQR